MADISYQDYASQMAQKYGVPENLFLWQIGTESSWNPTAQNPNSSAYGITQFTDATAKWRGVNRDDPYSSIEGAASYMQYLYGKTGSWMGALTAYGTIHDNPKKAAEAQAILNAEQSQANANGIAFDENNVPYPVDENGQSKYDKAFITGIFSGIGGIVLALTGIVLIVLAVLNTNAGKQAAKTVVTKGMA